MAMVAVSAIAFGTLAVFNRHLASTLSVPQMLCLRFAGGALVLWLVALARREVRRLPTRQALGFAALGLFYVGEAWLYFESSQRIPIALTALLLYLYPSLVVSAGWFFGGDAPGRRGIAALVTSSVGIALAVGAPEGSLDAAGVAFGVGTALVYTGYILLGARVQPGAGPAFGSAVLMTVSACVFGVAASVSGWPSSPWVDLAPDLVGLIVLGTAVPIPLLLIGMTRIGPSQASIISTLEPISAALCGAVFLNEALSPVQLVGAALVVTSVAIVATTKGPDRRSEPQVTTTS